MRAVHPEDMAHWSYAKLVLMSYVKAIETIDQLRRTCQSDFLWMPVEDIKRHGTEHSIPQRGSLFQIVIRT